MTAEIEAELALIEGALAAPSALDNTAAELEAAKAAVAACSGDDPAIPAAELVRRRREAADRLEVATIEHSRAEALKQEARDMLESRLGNIGRGLEELVVAEANRRKKIIFDALKEILGTGASRLPSLIEGAAPWVSGLTSLQLPLRNMRGDALTQLSFIRQALVALGDAGPAILNR